MHQYKGKLLLHTGSMFSGKTSSLEREIKRFRIAGYHTLVFKPSIDNRNNRDAIKSHDNEEIDAYSVDTVAALDEIAEREKADVIAVDEVQFLGGSVEEVLAVFNKYLDCGKTVVCAGLDMDFETNPFDLVKEIMARADYVEKHHAVCASCGADAWISHRTTKEEERVVIGATEKYEPLCRVCYNLKLKGE
ncbi:thymidine kinase [Peptoniphilus sp. KCTC 25270]|uniref:thymidine kinase n=1 Tax=Peptoniphilus sp. KCTC 25270 TaxID=2897414 RepID=UPI001E4E0DAA|nr:thymidine kinase [Peptoniphilus sp. KCTC 25270]MCD1146628.1 thymidine kinase [Peptoniphilus sp. KCTC 25270]